MGVCRAHNTQLTIVWKLEQNFSRCRCKGPASPFSTLQQLKSNLFHSVTSFRNLTIGRLSPNDLKDLFCVPRVYRWCKTCTIMVACSLCECTSFRRFYSLDSKTLLSCHSKATNSHTRNAHKTHRNVPPHSSNDKIVLLVAVICHCCCLRSHRQNNSSHHTALAAFCLPILIRAHNYHHRCWVFAACFREAK